MSPTMVQAKKDFQKAIAAIRRRLDNGEYPKAMMTGQQMAQNTATVNCGDRSEAEEVAGYVQSDPGFLAFLYRYGAIAETELAKDGMGESTLQVRIHFPAEE